MQYPKLIIIDGYVGAGKSTLIANLCERLNIAIVPEYIEEPDGIKRLNQYLNDKKTFAYSFQDYILDYYSKYLSSDAFKEQLAQVDYVVMERNPLRGITYFARKDRDQGFISPMGYNQLYTKASDLLCSIRESFGCCSQPLVTSFNTTSCTPEELVDDVLNIINWVEEIQLFADPDCIKERIAIRNRPGEIEAYTDDCINYMCLNYFM